MGILSNILNLSAKFLPTILLPHLEQGRLSKAADKEEMRDGANIRFGENCADVLAYLHQGRLEQLDDDHHDGGGGAADADDDQGQLRQLEVLLLNNQEEVEMEEELSFQRKKGVQAVIIGVHLLHERHLHPQHSLLAPT